MDSAVGWLLDVTIERNTAILWIRTLEGSILKLIDEYHPSFYILPKDERAGADFFQILSQEPKIRIEWRDKFTIPATIALTYPVIRICVMAHELQY